METTEFVKNFAEQFDETDAQDITIDTKFKDIEEWSSLIALSIIMMVEEEYDVNIGAKEIIGSETILDLFNVVKSKRN